MSRKTCGVLIALILAGRLVVAQDSVLEARSAAGRRLMEQGRFSEAETVFRETYDEAKRSGIEDRYMAMAANDLGSVYSVTDRYPEAEQLLRQSMGICERIFG